MRKLNDETTANMKGPRLNRVVYFVAILFGVFALAFAPGWAGAWKVSQGDDYTRTVNSKNGFEVCDMEADGRAVRGDARDARGAQVSESDGGDAGCDQQWNPPDISEINALQTCEIIDLWPDACTGFHGSKYPA